MSDKVSEAIYKAMRDDCDDLVGLRALLGETRNTPFNVYHAYLPERVDFRNSDGDDRSYVTYFMVSSTPDNSFSSPASRAIELLYDVTGYSRKLLTLEKIMRRVKWRLQDKRGVTNPSSLVAIQKIALDSEGSTSWDEAFKVYFKTATYRVWGRDDDLGN